MKKLGRRAFEGCWKLKNLSNQHLVPKGRRHVKACICSHASLVDVGGPGWLSSVEGFIHQEQTHVFGPLATHVMLHAHPKDAPILNAQKAVQRLSAQSWHG